MTPVSFILLYYVTVEGIITNDDDSHILGII